MTPEAKDYLEKAREDLADAKKIVAIGLSKVAARSAYYAGFHAAEAFIFEIAGKTAKTHSGVRAEFARLAKDTPGVDKDFQPSWRNLTCTRKYPITVLAAARV